MPISRRDFFASSLLASCFPTAARADTKIRYLLTSPSPNVAEAPHSSVPDLMGFWRASGLDVDVQPFNGSTGATQLIFAGTAEFTMASPEGFMVGRQNGAKGLAVYNHTREAIYTISVPADSPVQKVADLKGKTIGVSNLASGAVPVARALLRSAGLDPEHDVQWLAVGLGPQTANALKSKQVDALALWDWAYASLENLGYSFRHFTTPETRKLLSLMLIGNEDFISANPQAAAKMAEGIAKGALFTLTNPEAAVRLHWKKFPSSKPANVSEEQALKDAVHVLQARLEKYRIANREIPKWGAFAPSEWEATQNFFVDAGMLSRKVAVRTYYTDRFLGEINSFDPNVVTAAAQQYH